MPIDFTAARERERRSRKEDLPPVGRYIMERAFRDRALVRHTEGDRAAYMVNSARTLYERAAEVVRVRVFDVVTGRVFLDLGGGK